jgi:hypothetical protein
MKAEAIAVEVDRLVDVCYEVPHSRLRHLRFLRFVWTIFPLRGRVGTSDRNAPAGVAA